MATNLYRMVRLKPFLIDKAWPAVRASGLRSRSVDTQDAIRSFQAHAYQSLHRIQRQLQRNTFKFGPAKGIPIAKNSGGYRPLVVPEIPSRIVQRSILEVLKSQPAIREIADRPGSYGTSRQRQVRHAIRDICLAIDAGASYYIRTDIMDFFTRIPRLEVLQQLEGLLPDDSLNALLREATWYELDDVPARFRAMFPSYQEGVAQGSCLSPLLGNILLSEFDRVLNAGQVQTLRYVDDFIILGPNQRTVEEAFATVQEILQGLKMQAYDPFKNQAKAACGPTSRKFEFLGCSISPGFIQPSKKARNSFVSRVSRVLEDGGRQLRKYAFDSRDGYRRSLLATLTRVSQMVEAWTNHYDFCNAQQTFEQFDREVDRLLAKYIGMYSERRQKLDADRSRRLLGVWLAQDGKRSPIRNSD